MLLYIFLIYWALCVPFGWGMERKWRKRKETVVLHSDVDVLNQVEEEQKWRQQTQVCMFLGL